MSVVPFVAEAGTPMLAPVGATAVVLPMDDKKRWVFKTTQNDGLISEALVGHMVKSGVKTVGVIGFNDPYGDNWYAVFSAQAQKAGIKVVANEKFLRTDASVTGQVAKLMAAKPDAVLVAAAGGPTVLPQSRSSTPATRAASTRRTAPRRPISCAWAARRSTAPCSPRA